jgi:hypothetical protein
MLAFPKIRVERHLLQISHPKLLAIFLTVALMSLVIACGGGDSDAEDNSGNSNTGPGQPSGGNSSEGSNSSDSGGSSDSALSDIDPSLITKFSGSDSSSDGVIQLEEGVLIGHATSKGGHFAVLIKQDDVIKKDLLFNETSKFSGDKAILITALSSGLNPGPATLEVTASSDWTLELETAPATGGRSPNFSLSGSGNAVVPGIQFAEGAYSFAVDNKKEIGFFAITMYHTGGGSHSKSIANGTAAFTDSFEFKVNGPKGAVAPAGVWAMTVQSGGEWEIMLK